MKTSEQLNEFALAFAKAQGALKTVAKDKRNPAFNARYADLSSMMEVLREPFANNGLAVFQSVSTVEGGVVCCTRVIHASGQWVEDDGVFVPVVKANAHGHGSAITYARRYSLGGATGLVSDIDDDGNAAATGSSPLEPDDQPQYPHSPPPAPITAARIAEIEKYINDAGTIDELAEVWSGLSVPEKLIATRFKNERKAKLEEASGE